MNLENAIYILKDYVKRDRQLRDNKTESDFEQFCETTCIAIETVLNKLEKEGNTLRSSDR